MESRSEVRNQSLVVRELEVRELEVSGWRLEVSGWEVFPKVYLTFNFYRLASRYILNLKFYLIVSLYLLTSTTLNAQTLEDYFKIAAESNPGLQAKYKSFEANMEKVVQVSSLPDPNLSFGYFISPVETRVGPQQAKFSLTQMFPWFGTLKAKEDVAAWLAEAKYQEFLDARNQLYYQVAASYYPLYELQRLIEIEQQNERILRSYKEIATSQYQNNEGAMVDVLRVDIMLNDVATNLVVLNQKKKPLEIRFNTLLNREESETIVVQDSLFMAPLTEGYHRDSLIIANPLIAELDLKIKASAAQEQVAIKQGLPIFGVGLDYVIVGERSDATLSDNGKDVFMPMVSVSLPIFRGKYKAAQQEAQLMQNAYAYQKEDVSNQLTSAYEMSWFDIQKQAELIALYTAQIRTSEQSLRLLFSAYSNSGTEFEEVLRMQQQILKYQKLKATAMAKYHIALAELDYLTAKSK